MPLKIADRGVVPPFIAMDVMQAAAAREAIGRHVLHLEVGQPGTPAPAPVRAAAKAALDGHRLGYTLALGNNEAYYREVLEAAPGQVLHGGDQWSWWDSVNRATAGMTEIGSI